MPDGAGDGHDPDWGLDSAFFRPICSSGADGQSNESCSRQAQGVDGHVGPGGAAEGSRQRGGEASPCHRRLEVQVEDAKRLEQLRGGGSFTTGARDDCGASAGRHLPSDCSENAGGDRQRRDNRFASAHLELRPGAGQHCQAAVFSAANAGANEAREQDLLQLGADSQGCKADGQCIPSRQHPPGSAEGPRFSDHAQARHRDGDGGSPLPGGAPGRRPRHHAAEDLVLPPGAQSPWSGELAAEGHVHGGDHIDSDRGLDLNIDGVHAADSAGAVRHGGAGGLADLAPHVGQHAHQTTSGILQAGASSTQGSVGMLGFRGGRGGERLGAGGGVVGGGVGLGGGDASAVPSGNEENEGGNTSMQPRLSWRQLPPSQKGIPCFTKIEDVRYKLKNIMRPVDVERAEAANALRAATRSERANAAVKLEQRDIKSQGRQLNDAQAKLFVLESRLKQAVHARRDAQAARVEVEGRLTDANSIFDTEIAELKTSLDKAVAEAESWQAVAAGRAREISVLQQKLSDKERRLNALGTAAERGRVMKAEFDRGYLAGADGELASATKIRKLNDEIMQRKQRADDAEAAAATSRQLVLSLQRRIGGFIRGRARTEEAAARDRQKRPEKAEPGAGGVPLRCEPVGKDWQPPPPTAVARKRARDSSTGSLEQPASDDADDAADDDEQADAVSGGDNVAAAEPGLSARQKRRRRTLIRGALASVGDDEIGIALGTVRLKSICHSSKAGSAVLFDFGQSMAEQLTTVWDQQLAMDLKIDASLTDEQMDEMRRSFSLQQSAKRVQDGKRKVFVPRTWVYNHWTKRKIKFPQPVVARPRWKRLIGGLCSELGIEQHADGRVAERGCVDGLQLLISRNMKLAPAGAGLSQDWPLNPTTAWDAVSWQHRKVTHGGWKFADFRPDVSSQSEWKFVTCGIGKCDDGWEGQRLLLHRFAPDFNALCRAGSVDVDGFGTVFVAPKACTDLAFTRSSNGRRGSSFSHCKCGGCAKDHTDARHNALHEPPDVRAVSTWADAEKIMDDRCKIFSHAELWELSHLAPPDYTWEKPWKCQHCGRDVHLNLEAQTRAVAELEALKARAVKDDLARRELKKIRDAHAKAHYDQELYHHPMLAVEMKDWMLDIMHGLDLNLAKVGFKYAFLDGILDEQREEMAMVLHEAGCAFDVRKREKDGGSRSDDKKWMKASQVNIFCDGKSHSCSEQEGECGEALARNVMRLCDVRYLDPGGKPVPLPANERAANAPAPPPAAPPAARAFQRPGAAQRARAQTSATERSPARSLLATAASKKSGLSRKCDPNSWRDRNHPAYEGESKEWAEAVQERYTHWAPKVMWIVRFWKAFSEMRSILKEECLLRTGPADAAVVQARQEKARRFFLAAVAFWNALEAISNSRHKSVYNHNWALVLPRQIAATDDMWQFATPAIEFRGARITRRKACWRMPAKEYFRSSCREGQITKFKSTYGSGPMTQIMRDLCVLEASRHDEQSVTGAKAALQLTRTGRSSRRRLEPKMGYQAVSTELFAKQLNLV